MWPSEAITGSSSVQWQQLGVTGSKGDLAQVQQSLCGHTIFTGLYDLQDDGHSAGLEDCFKALCETGEDAALALCPPLTQHSVNIF